MAGSPLVFELAGGQEEPACCGRLAGTALIGPDARPAQVSCLAISPDGDQLACGFADGTLALRALRDAEGGRWPLVLVPAHGGAVTEGESQRAAWPGSRDLTQRFDWESLLNPEPGPEAPELGH